jgi:nicotinamide-nucleotide amidase
VKVELLTTGSELLLGHVVNTHTAFLGRELFALGLRVARQVSAPDGPAIGEALAEALGRADLVIVTGGLGPTSDDVTREVAAALLGLPLAFDPAILAKIDGYFTQRGRPTDPLSRNQAMVPRGAFVLANDVGTAPGLVLEYQGKLVVLLPGPPRELQPMWSDAFVPWFRARGDRPPLFEKNWCIVGIGESRVAQRIEEPLRALGLPEIGYCARPGEVDLRLVSGDAALLERAAAVVRAEFGDAIATEGHETLERLVVRLATARGWTVATAESCTGGLLGHRLTNVPGSSAIYRHGWITYADTAKTSELGVPAALLAPGGPGAVSGEVARAMAEGARSRAGADLAVAITGIAGPGGGSAEKPVGTCWLAVASARGTEAVQKILSNDRETFKQMASQTALDLLRRALQIETSV